MEFLNGETIDKILEKGQMGLSEFLQITEQALDGIASAHRKSILHGDIKPSNIMTHFLTDGTLQAKVLDFGLARIAHQPVLSDVGDDGAVCGSVHFMAPEQLLGSVLDARSDLYSFGCVCYAMLTGQVPHDGHTMKVIINQHLQDEPKPLQELRPDVPMSICQWVDWLMKKDADQRPPDAASALIALKNLHYGEVKDMQEVLKQNATNRITSIVKPTTQIIYDPSSRAAILTQNQLKDKSNHFYRTAISIGVASLGLGVLGIGVGYLLRQTNKLQATEPTAEIAVSNSRSVNGVKMTSEAVKNGFEHPLLDFTRSPDFVYGDWKQQAVTLFDEELHLDADSAMGGLGYMVTENLSKCRKMRPAVRLVIGPQNTLKNLKLLLRSDDTYTAVWFFNLEYVNKETEILLASSREFPLHLPQEVVDQENKPVATGATEIVNFSDIKQIQISGDYLKAEKVDLTIKGVVLIP
jgi:serine/threonine protein kinase